jgi:ADP-ribosylglycohydrolase
MERSIKPEILGYLLSNKGLYQRRLPGKACLTALKSPDRNFKTQTNMSKGSAAVDRVAPLGLRFDHPEDVFRQGAEAAAITHGHFTSSISAGAFACLINILRREVIEISEAVKKILAIVRVHENHEETSSALELALELANDYTLPPHLAISKLGKGYMSEEALAISTYCALKARNFKDGILLAVNHAGNSNSVGSITGNILGLVHGLQGVPENWLTELEFRDEIVEIASDLHDSIETNIFYNRFRPLSAAEKYPVWIHEIKR